MNASFRIPADIEYTGMLGRAVYNFAYYEYVVIWTIEKLDPGYLHHYATKTSGIISSDFSDRVQANPQAVPEMQTRLAACAATFDTLRKERDKLLHAHPYTAAGGTQQLGYRGRHPSAEWPLPEVEAAARKFDEAACELNELFYQLWPSP
jgi:hypothetical protein